jgi:hypothetical protein
MSHLIPIFQLNENLHGNLRVIEHVVTRRVNSYSLTCMLGPVRSGLAPSFILPPTGLTDNYITHVKTVELEVIRHKDKPLKRIFKFRKSEIFIQFEANAVKQRNIYKTT